MLLARVRCSPRRLRRAFVLQNRQPMYRLRLRRSTSARRAIQCHPFACYTAVPLAHAALITSPRALSILCAEAAIDFAPESAAHSERSPLVCAPHAVGVPHRNMPSPLVTAILTAIPQAQDAIVAQSRCLATRNRDVPPRPHTPRVYGFSRRTRSCVSPPATSPPALLRPQHHPHMHPIPSLDHRTLAHSLGCCGRRAPVFSAHPDPSLSSSPTPAIPSHPPVPIDGQRTTHLRDKHAPMRLT
ncbi:hypothetical protein B0H12DRAFT_126487 [Mycena haematopus]|nr:hypothetical protein B0H12DRAFT_126487 [Mycena haematopus]